MSERRPQLALIPEVGATVPIAALPLTDQPRLIIPISPTVTFERHLRPTGPQITKATFERTPEGWKRIS